MADATNSAPLFNNGRPLPTQHTNLDLATIFVAARLESYDRIWDLVLGAESEGQGYVPVSAIRAALTKAMTS
jgi:hypothetical protein